MLIGEVPSLDRGCGFGVALCWVVGGVTTNAGV